MKENKMIIESGRTGTVEELKSLLESACRNEQVKTVFVLACDENGYTTENINGILKDVPVPLFGGIFPQIILDKETLSKGCIVAGMPSEADIRVISGLSDPSIDYESILEDRLPRADAKTMFVLVDGYSTRISSLVDSLFNVLGLEFNYVGAGAGSMSFKQKPCLMTNAGLIQDGAILATMNIESGVGVSHGWAEIGGPFKVTESRDNIIYTLDWKPAFEVYKEVVENHSGLKFDEHEFFDISQSYPFGINRLDAEKIVRDPFKIGQGNSLVCFGDVPQEFYVHILTGDTNSLVSAAKGAMEFGRKSFVGSEDNCITLFFDCVSRVMFLKEDFTRELEAVHIKGMPLIGALTIGEIANNGKEYLEFYNKTSVVGILES